MARKRRRARKTLISGVVVVAAAAAGWVGLGGFEWIAVPNDGAAVEHEEAAGEQRAAPTLESGGDYYDEAGPAQVLYEAVPGEISYCPLDELERPTCAYGALTPELREAARERGREDIDVDPAGWPADNGEVLIPARDDVDGSEDYSGWLWNRSHLVADSLGGAPERVNLVAGTRTQNVGSTRVEGEYAGGMAYTEKIARDYLDSGAAADCPLYYAATPQYQAEELIPRYVEVDVRSCGGDIDMRVTVVNAAAGFSIDYLTGATEPAEDG